MKGILEFSLKIKGFPLEKAKMNLRETLLLRGSQFDSWQKFQRDQIVQYHTTHNKLYKSKVAGLDTSDFESLPIITKRDFQGGFDAIVSNDFRIKDLYKGSTSGSSGHPFYFVKDKEAHARTHALIMQRYGRHGLQVDDRQARFFGIPLQGSGRYKELFKDKLANRVRFPVFDMSDQVLQQYLDKFGKVSFDYVYGYTSAILVFAKYIISRNLILKQICPSLRFCIVTSEVCTPEDKAIIEKAFGVNLLNEYGASELDVMAFTNPNGDWELSVQNVYFEVVDDNNNVLPLGQEGRILVTSLFNKAMPVIRYEIGDMGIINRKGDTFILEKLSGRVNDMVLLPSGRRSAGLTFYYVAKSILETTNVIKEFIIRQVSLNEFIFDVVSERDISIDEYEVMKEKMDLYLEPGLNLVINRVERIERPRSGKIKHFYSQIN